MSETSRAPRLSQPGGWLARAVVPARRLGRWGWTWRLAWRVVATLLMSTFGVLGISAAIASGHLDWFELLCWASGWVFSVGATVLVIVAFVRRPRSRVRR
jgi:hypothetical protein